MSDPDPRARLKAAIAKQDEERGRPLTDRERLENLSEFIQSKEHQPKLTNADLKEIHRVMARGTETMERQMVPIEKIKRDDTQPSASDRDLRLADLLARRADVHNWARERYPYYGDDDIDLLRAIIAEKDAALAVARREGATWGAEQMREAAARLVRNERMSPKHGEWLWQEYIPRLIRALPLPEPK